MLLEWTAGWPVGTRLAERCAGQRHFMGYASDDGEPGGSVRRPYLLRALMGFCMFHSCKEVAYLSEQDLAAHGVGNYTQPAAGGGGGEDEGGEGAEAAPVTIFV